MALQLTQTSNGNATTGTTSVGKEHYANSLNHYPNAESTTPQLEFSELGLREHLKALPTKNNVQLLITAVETTCKQAVEM